jgi:hypothetical protein
VVVCDRSQWLTRAGLASNGRNVALDEPRKSRWSEGFRSGHGRGRGSKQTCGSSWRVAVCENEL